MSVNSLLHIQKYSTFRISDKAPIYVLYFSLHTAFPYDLVFIFIFSTFFVALMSYLSRIVGLYFNNLYYFMFGTFSLYSVCVMFCSCIEF